MESKWLNSLTLALGLTLISLVVHSLDLSLLQLLENKYYDFKVRSRGERPVTGQVVIVAVDENSLQQEGRWPWSRTLMARLVDRISQAGAAAIGFDIFFPEREDHLPYSAVRERIEKQSSTPLDPELLIEWLDQVGAADRRFAEALERSGKAVLGYFVYAAEGLAGFSAEKLNQKHLDLLDFSQFSIVQRFDSPKNPVHVRPIYSVGMSLPEFMNGANSAGYVSFVPEMDGIIRWVPLVMQSGDNFFPPLSLQVLHEATRLPTGVRIAPFGVDGVRLGDAVIPTTEIGDFLVNFYGPGYTFTHHSAADVLSGKVGARELQGKMVLVGGTAAGTHDIHTSPYGPLYPGVEIHANVIESILQRDFLIRPDWLRILDLLMILVSGTLLGVVSRFFKAYAMAVVLVLGVVGYIGVDYYLFSREGLWINAVYPVFTQVFVYSGITLFRFAFEEREKRFIKGAFSQYLAPAVVNRLVDNPHLLKLGGERKVLTAFFSDVAGFSSISERLPPDALVELLNLYLTEMTDIIMQYEGTVDKFEGDAIIAFFGAPLPYEDHARRACLAALDMQERLGELRWKWKQQGKQELFMRIGINTGSMVIGNMGSKTRMDYTMMGDSVNLASRLEGVNKQYQTHTMISEFTFEQAKGHIEARELDSIRVVGKKEPVRVYELLGKKGELDETLLKLLQVFGKGLDHYKHKRWDDALGCFKKAQALDPKDGPSRVYRGRCEEFLIQPPPEDWDGVYSMVSK